MLDRRHVGPLLLLGLFSITACPTRRNNGNDVGPGSNGNSGSVHPFASNGGDVTRFQDEIPLGPEALVAQDGTVVRNSPDNGDTVATLTKGVAVVELSTHGLASLVVFDDPKGGGRRLMGWILDSALEDVSPQPGPTPPVLPLTDGGAFDSGGGWEDSGPPQPAPGPSPNPNPGKHHHHRQRPHQ
jgi:hypothetical protein